jgi:hypothetical protein
MVVDLDGLCILRRFYRKPESRKIHLYVKISIFWDITSWNQLKVISRKIELFITTAVTTPNPIHLHVVRVDHIKKDLYWTDAN